MKDILLGILLIFVLPSVIQFWIWFIKLEKTNQINLKK